MTEMRLIELEARNSEIAPLRKSLQSGRFPAAIYVPKSTEKQDFLEDSSENWFWTEQDQKHCPQLFLSD
jgi:hypothetical protein